jgi:hypothetical protein
MKGDESSGTARERERLQYQLLFRSQLLLRLYTFALLSLRPLPLQTLLPCPNSLGTTSRIRSSSCPPPPPTSTPLDLPLTSANRILVAPSTFTVANELTLRFCGDERPTRAVVTGSVKSLAAGPEVKRT